uniref:Zinc finger protein ubi-d4 n=1 Tax=Panagrellus redivivus TaxID=6233 RepID=A0A7E4W657_PANRE
MDDDLKPGPSRPPPGTDNDAPGSSSSSGAGSSSRDAGESSNAGPSSSSFNVHGGHSAPGASTSTERPHPDPANGEQSKSKLCTEAEYMTYLYSCMNFNKVVTGYRNRSVPFYDQSTNLAYYPTKHLTRHAWERYNPGGYGNLVCAYPPVQYKRNVAKASSSSDAVEFRHILNTDPKLKSAVEKLTEPAESAGPSASGSGPSTVNEKSNDSHSQSPFKSTVTHGKTNFENLDDEFFNLGDSDEDDWEEKKKKRRKRGPAKDSPAKPGRKPIHNFVPITQAPRLSTQLFKPPPPIKPYECPECSAKYKSRNGLRYHNLHTHTEVTQAAQDRRRLVMSPELQISETCDFCQGTKERNLRTDEPEDMITCHDCGHCAHGSCLNFTPNMIASAKRHGWQCIECKCCTICGTSDNDHRLLFCDDCDRGFHCDCLAPPLAEPPDNEWSCLLCQEVYGASASAPKQAAESK